MDVLITIVLVAIPTVFFIHERLKRTIEMNDLQKAFILYQMKRNYSKQQLVGAKTRIINFVKKMEKPAQQQDIYKEMNKIKPIEEGLFVVALLELKEEDLLKEAKL